MGYAPLARIFVRYVVGAILGMEAGQALAGDVDLIAVLAVALGAATEAAYAIAKRRGWTT